MDRDAAAAATWIFHGSPAATRIVGRDRRAPQVLVVLTVVVTVMGAVGALERIVDAWSKQVRHIGGARGFLCREQVVTEPG